MQDFAATIAAKNEFIILAVRDVPVVGSSKGSELGSESTAPVRTEEHIVAFVNYYLSWFHSGESPPGARPPPAPVAYIATLQVRLCTVYLMYLTPCRATYDNRPTAGREV